MAATRPFPVLRGSDAHHLARTFAPGAPRALAGCASVDSNNHAQTAADLKNVDSYSLCKPEVKLTPLVTQERTRRQVNCKSYFPEPRKDEKDVDWLVLLLLLGLHAGA